MSNSWFQFKEFRIDQDRCAMKVTTDACILGACVQQGIKGNVLDIGTGTGLLSLMLAQRNNCFIDAVELDKESFNQAKENVAASKWSSRINVINADIRNFVSEKKYDFIICNPPFFENHLKSSFSRKNKARHADDLSMEELMLVVNRLLDDDGIFCVLLPEYSSAKLIACGGNYNLLPFRKIMIRDSINSKVISTIHFFVYRFPRSINEMRSFEERTLTLKDEAGNYTSDLKELLGDFYLHF